MLSLQCDSFGTLAANSYLITDVDSGESALVDCPKYTQRMRNFIAQYNETYNENLRIDDDGIILLQENANKRGLELRLYVRSCPPPDVRNLGFTRNNAYRSEYSYRLNSNDVVNYLFEHGYRIGVN